MALDENETSLVKLYEELNHFKNIERDLIHTNNAAMNEETIDDEDLNELIEKLQAEMTDIASAKEIQELAIRQLQIADIIDKSELQNQQESSTNKLTELLQERDAISEKIMNMHKKTMELKSEITKLQKEENNMAADNQECIKFLENKKMDFSKKNETRDSELTKKLNHRISKKKTQAKIMSCILRFLITGSAIDWMKNDDLKEIMLKPRV